MEKLNEFLHSLLSTSGYELRLEPNKNPCVLSANGPADLSTTPLKGTQISMMVFPLIPADIKQELPNKPEVRFMHPHNLGNFDFVVQKSPSGFKVIVTPATGVSGAAPAAGTVDPAGSDLSDLPSAPVDISAPLANEPEAQSVVETAAAVDEKAEDYDFNLNGFVPPAEEYVPSPEPEAAEVPLDPGVIENAYDDGFINEQIDVLFRAMAKAGASDLHLSVGMPPMIRKDGRITPLEGTHPSITGDGMPELLSTIMPEKNRDEFEARHDTDFAYEIQGLARFRCNVFMDRKGMGGVFRIIPSKMTTADQIGLSSHILGLCDLSKGLVVVTGPTGSGKSTTLCAMVNHINQNRDEHIITIEDPIEFVHENINCLVNQREVHNHTDSFKNALRAALREDPDILLVGEMRDLETISIAIETAETGHLVFGTLHTTTAASTVDRIIDQFPADRQQQIRVMLSESLKGVIAQTLLPKKGGGRVAALEVLIVTPAISNLIREGKTFQIPSAMQTGKNHGMVMLNDALFELVKNGLVEPRDAYIKSVDKTGFDAMLTRGGFSI
ncbi:MAG: type IV pilus twitching motility protein PilT [Acidobacteriota bacterium]